MEPGKAHPFNEAGVGSTKPISPQVYSSFERIFAPHVNSFNYAATKGLKMIEKTLRPAHVHIPSLPSGDMPHLSLRLEGLKLERPTRGHIFPSQKGQKGVDLKVGSADEPMYPAECREAGKTYSGMLKAMFVRVDAKGESRWIEMDLGLVPVMVKSVLCNLYGMSPKDLVKHHEEGHECGGFFVTGGLDRLFRLLIAPRANYITAIKSSAFGKRGPSFSPYAVSIRCREEDMNTKTIAVNYLTTGNCVARFRINKREYIIPVTVLLRAFRETTDEEMYQRIVGKDEDQFHASRAEIMLEQGAHQFNLKSNKESLQFLGARFRNAMGLYQGLDDMQAGKELLSQYVFPHLHKGGDKLMIRKLLWFVRNKGRGADNPDATANQEILLSGHLWLITLKERLQDWLHLASDLIQKACEKESDPAAKLMDDVFLHKALAGSHSTVGRRVEMMLRTGNLQSHTGLDLQQESGFSIIAEKLNFLRYISHFASVHRGAFFTEMKTTSVRKLLPESWGFLCPVHTPDGTPCGLLNHLAMGCEIVCSPLMVRRLPLVLATLGMTPAPDSGWMPSSDALHVVLDGQVVGWVKSSQAKQFCGELRDSKLDLGNKSVPDRLEIVCMLEGESALYPGIYLFSTPGRMVRPVLSLAGCTGERKHPVEYIGSLEQIFLSVACQDEDVTPGVSTHRERNVQDILSVVAALTPFSDFNQSPRNMYQCQMGKQAMATPLYALPHRVDNKLYRLTTVQTPIVRTKAYDEYHMDEYPIGMHAVVAVISYTGYDMEDAMIINKASYERGFMHGQVYKTKIIDLSDRKQRFRRKTMVHFNNLKTDAERMGDDDELFTPKLDRDGLPFVGQRIKLGDPLYCVFNDQTGRHRVVKHKEIEGVTVEQVRVVDTNDEEIQKVHLLLRYGRNPIVGDKFSSRHGQKGVMSQLWPEQDMPFSESGMCPDIIFNPHGFPSRMTIGMMVESMAGKAGAMHGVWQNATPFTFNEKHRAGEFFGEQLKKAGYNYWGNEPMYSGIHGCEMRADIFIGLVYYQRLRHMVSDKYQVRATGALNRLTRQPVKGRKVGGGIRLGEMERDALLAHGVSYLLKDRIMRSSDGHKCYLCKACGSILSPIARAATHMRPASVSCVRCKSGDDIELVEMPFVVRYLSAELAAMNIHMALDV